MPSNPAGKRGFIFDEANERSGKVRKYIFSGDFFCGKVRFQNIAGEQFAQCTSDVEVRTIRSVEEMFDKKTSTLISSSNLQLGAQFDVNLNYDWVGTIGNSIMSQVGKLLGSSKGQESTIKDEKEIHGSANLELCAGASAKAGFPPFGSAEAFAKACARFEVGGKWGVTTTDKINLEQLQQASANDLTGSDTSFSQSAAAGISFTIPPIAKSLASSDERVQTLATSIDSKEVITTVASTHCKRYVSII